LDIDWHSSDLEVEGSAVAELQLATRGNENTTRTFQLGKPTMAKPP